jgi:hypothetical protein
MKLEIGIASVPRSGADGGGADGAMARLTGLVGRFPDDAMSSEPLAPYLSAASLPV